MKLKPLGSNQTELTLNDGVTVLFSYQTPVAVHVPGKGFYRTSEKFSKTTTRHINAWLGGAKAETIPQDRIEILANEGNVISRNPPNRDVMKHILGMTEPSGYGWVILKDHLAEPGSKIGTNENAVGISGPRDINNEHSVMLNEGKGVPFKMYDDDGELMYSGKFVGDWESEDGFGPLNDYGEPNAGATRIDYRNPKTGKWETL